jgi:hypothetical protein
LDYFLIIEENEEQPENYEEAKNNVSCSKNRLNLDRESIRVEKFQVEGESFTQLSDHYGLSAELAVKIHEEYNLT